MSPGFFGFGWGDTDGNGPNFEGIPDYSDRPGFGSSDAPGFPADGSLDLPNLAEHHTTAAAVLRSDPSIYRKLRERQTPLGVHIGRCIKSCVDFPGQSEVTLMGTTAGDADSYEVFRDFFDPVLERCLGTSSLGIQDFDAGSEHVTDLGRHGRGLTTARMDTSGKYVLYSEVQIARNLTGFRFTPAMTFSERCEVERLVVGALLRLSGKYRGKYYSLRGSESLASQAGGMSLDEEAALQQRGLLFSEPDVSTRVASGAARHWPHGRGVFVNDADTFSARVNRDEHLSVTAVQRGDALQLAFRALVRALDSIAVLIRQISSVNADGSCGAPIDGYAYSGRLGYLTSDPRNLGTAMRASLILRVPRLARLAQMHRRSVKQEERSGTSTGRHRLIWREWCARQRVRMLRICNSAGRPVPCLYELTNLDRLGATEVETINLVVKAAACIVRMEQRLEVGACIDDLLASDVGHLSEDFLEHYDPKACDDASSEGSSPSPPRSPSWSRGGAGHWGPLDTVDEDSAPPSPLPRQIPTCENESCRRCRWQGKSTLSSQERVQQRRAHRLNSGRTPNISTIFNYEDDTARSGVEPSRTHDVADDDGAASSKQM